MRTNVQIISPTAAAAQQGRGTRVTLVDPNQGLPHRTHVEIQGIEDVSADAVSANDPMKTRVQILTPIEADAPEQLLTSGDPRAAMVAAIDAERRTLASMEETARACYERLEKLQESLAEQDDLQQAVAAAAEAAGDGQQIIETTGEEKLDPAAAFRAEQKIAQARADAEAANLEMVAAKEAATRANAKEREQADANHAELLAAKEASKAEAAARQAAREAAAAEAAAAEAAAAEAAAAETAAAEEAAKAERPSRRGRRKTKDKDKG